MELLTGGYSNFFYESSCELINCRRQKDFGKLLGHVIPVRLFDVTDKRKGTQTDASGEIPLFLPKNENIEAVKMLIRCSSNEINQIIRSTHILRMIDNSTLKNLVAEQNQMQKELTDFYYRPKVIFSPADLYTHAH